MVCKQLLTLIFQDTSRNFKKLRDYARHQHPPMIPYLPIVLKGDILTREASFPYPQLFFMQFAIEKAGLNA